MTCPICGAKTRVVDCRKDCETVVRRRKCTECGYIFYTEETESTSKVYRSVEREYKKMRKNGLAKNS